MIARSRPLSTLLAVAALPCSALLAGGPAAAQATGDLSVQLDGWSSNRRADSGESKVNAEVWATARIPLDPALALEGEGWIASNPRGDGTANADLRRGYVEGRSSGVTLKAGRQIMVWGRADRINPTDTLSARDHQRLVFDEDENRLGQFAVSVAIPLAGGSLTGIWQPEFRPSKLPQGQTIPDLAPQGSQGSAALRYERFGSGLDFALTLSRGPDHTPWLASTRVNGLPATGLLYPRMTMLGADFATTRGAFGIRLEAARYWHDRTALAGITDRTPRFAAVAGIDCSLPGQWLVIAQAVLRTSERHAATPTAISGRNALIHGAWKSTVTGATLAVRKAFAADRGQIEATGAWLSGGGSFAQFRASLAITDQVRVHALGERHFGSSESYFGRLQANNAVMLGIRAGF